MNAHTRLAILALFLLLSNAGCGAAQVEANTPVEIANPASVYCKEQGGRLELRSDAAGAVTGYCLFDDGSECEEWAYFRAECMPVSSGTAVPPVSNLDADWIEYRNDELGYRFLRPSDAHIETSDDPLDSLTVVGAQEGWPSFTLSHPSDREEFRPPEGADLESWLTDHSLLPTAPEPIGAETRMPNTTIAGLTAIHTRFDRSDQSFAFDRYYFAKDGQLYMLIIGHVNDREDWALYQRFLDGFQFMD